MIDDESELQDLEATYRVLETMREDEFFNEAGKDRIQHIHYLLQLYEEHLVETGVISEKVK